MKIFFNGTILEEKENITLSELLSKYNLNKEEIIVKLNNKIILKENFSKTILKENDSIDWLLMMSGG